MNRVFSVQKIVKWSILICYLFGIGSIYSAIHAMDCIKIEAKRENKNLVLPGPIEKYTQVMYFFKNQTQQSIWLDHPVRHASASAGWSSYIHPGHWSAIVVNRRDFTISCAVIKPGKVDYLDCSRALSVCSPKPVPMLHGKSTYWVAEDKPWDDLLKAIGNRKLH